MSTPYSRGYSFELKVKKYLEELGYSVFRVGGSHSPADLIAMRKIPDSGGVSSRTEVTLVQCQRSKYFSKDKKSELEELATKVGARHTLAWAEDARKPGNNAIRFDDDAIIGSAPRSPRVSRE